MNEPTLEVFGLKKNFPGSIHAVKGVSFEVKKGEFFSILGPNGAGKSTTIKMLTTLIKPTGGNAKIMGFCLKKQAREIRKIVGVSLQTAAIDPGLTGTELVILQSRLFGFSNKMARKRADELIHLVGLEKDAKRPCGTYSGGMQRRLDLALSLVHRPKILFLDEPTAGLDPAGRARLWREIQKLKNEMRTTIVMTTQYLEEADKMSDRICIINGGEIVSMGTPEALKGSCALHKLQISFSSKRDCLKAKKALAEEFPIFQEKLLNMEILTKDTREKLPKILRSLSGLGVFPQDISASSPSLDDVFLQLVSKSKERIKKGGRSNAKAN